jgi:hypothetical protein
MLLLSWTFSFRRGCQMVYLNTKIPIFGIFWRALEWKILVYYLALWYIWWPFVNFMIFGKFNGHLLNLVNIFVHFLHFGTLYRRKSDNPASKCIVTKSLITKSAPNDSHFFVRICTRKKMSFLIDPEKVIKNMTLVRKTWNYFFLHFYSAQEWALLLDVGTILLHTPRLYVDTWQPIYLRGRCYDYIINLFIKTLKTNWRYI